MNTKKAERQISPHVKEFNWEYFKKYVETYSANKHGGNNPETIFQDMLYGLGSAIDEKYKFINGFKQFKQYLVNRLSYL